MNKISYFTSTFNTTPIKSITIAEAFDIIKGSDLKHITQELRTISSKEKASEYKRIKFPAVIFAGEVPKRADIFLTSYTDVVCIDIDDLDKDTLTQTLTLLALIKDSLLAFFISPSGTGLKVLVKVKEYKTNTKNIYKALCIFLSDKLKISFDQFDQSCSNLSRLCFLCWDPNAYLNEKINPDGSLEQVPVFEIEEWLQKINIVSTSPDNANEDEDSIELITHELELNENTYDYKRGLDFKNKASYHNLKSLVSIVTTEYGAFKKGNRHTFLQRLTSYANMFGIPKPSFAALIRKYFSRHSELNRIDAPFNLENEGVKIIDDTYARYVHQFQTWVPSKNEEFVTPFIPDEVFTSLPLFFKGAFDGCPNKRQRDVLFLGMLGVLSSCFPRIRGFYDNKFYGANLFILITAPASAGKGQMMFARMLGIEFNKRLKWEYLKSLEQYEIDIAEYNTNKANGTATEKPKMPELKKFFIPGNSSSASMLACIANNKYFGVINEAEIDTLANTLKTEWGNFSDLLRKAFHHESVDLLRRKDKEDLHIESPFLSVVLSGTPDQAYKFISSVENGFFSRFLFYSFLQNIEWHNVFEKRNYSIQDFFRKLSTALYYISEPFFKEVEEDNSNMILFSFTSEQEQKFNKYFDEKMKQLINIYGEHITASIKRLGVCFFRIAMILSTLRQVQLQGGAFNHAKDFFCTDQDFATTEKIISTLLFHTTEVFKQVHRFKKNRFASGTNKEVYLKKLPDEFNREAAMAVAALLEINPKTAEKYLSDFVHTNELLKPAHNYYKKNLNKVL